MMEQTSSSNQNEAGDVDQQLQAMSEKLHHLLLRLEEQCEKCATKPERKYLNHLRKEAKRQLATIGKLQDTVEDTTTIITKSSAILKNPICEKAILQRKRRAVSDPNDILFQTIAAPFVRPYRLVQQSRNIELSEKFKLDLGEKFQDLSEKFKLWRIAMTATRSSVPAENKSSHGSSSTLEQYPSSISDGNNTSGTGSRSASPADDTDLESQSAAYETTSLPPSASSSPRISVQDWSILTPPEGPKVAPPLPRKSSRRVSYTPRVPSAKSMPPMPTTPPPSVPEWAELSQASTRDPSAGDLLSNLEKRFSLTIATPPVTP